MLIAGMALAIVFSTFASLPANVGAAPFTATANLNIRSGPDTSFPVVGGIPSGGAVEVTGDVQGNYYPVAYDGISGFASADFLTAGNGGDEEETAAGPTGTRYVRDGRLNLRTGPSTSNGVIAVMPDGAEVQLGGNIANGFSEVTWNGTIGWAATAFLSTDGGFDEPTPEPATPVTPPSDVPSIGDTPIGTAVVTSGGSSLNMRSGPATNFGVIRSLPRGA